MIKLLNFHPFQVAIEHKKYQEKIGIFNTAAEQCQFLADDPDSTVTLETGDLSEICNRMVCDSPRRTGSFPAGPAMDGTRCGNGMECYSGSCVYRGTRSVGSSYQEPKWGDWNHNPCESGCISGSIPVEISNRKCITDDVGCSGSRRQVKSCKSPTNTCTKEYQNANDFAKEMCQEYKQSSEDLDKKITENGLMVPFNKKFPDRVCMIHCMDKSGEPFAPYTEAALLGLQNKVIESPKKKINFNPIFLSFLMERDAVKIRNGIA